MFLQGEECTLPCSRLITTCSLLILNPPIFFSSGLALNKSNFKWPPRISALKASSTDSVVVHRNSHGLY